MSTFPPRIVELSDGDEGQTGWSPTPLFELSRQRALIEFKTLSIKGLITDRQLQDITEQYENPEMVHDVVRLVQKLPAFSPQQTSFSTLRRLGGFLQDQGEGLLQRLQRFTRVLDTATQAHVFGCLLWSSVKVVVLVWNDIRDARDVLQKQLQRLLDDLGIVGSFKGIFERIEEFHGLIDEDLSILYDNVLQWTIFAFKFFGNRRSRLLQLSFMSGIRRRGYNDEAKAIFEDIEVAKDHILMKINMFNMQKSHVHRERMWKDLQQREKNHKEVLGVLEDIRKGEQTEWREPESWTVFQPPRFPLKQDFVGRETQLRSLKDTLTASGRIVVCGPAGIGKSQTVLQYMTREASHYELRFWIDSSGLETFRSGMLALFHQMKYETPALEDTAKLFALKRSLEMTDHSWLLVLDDCSYEVHQYSWEFLPVENGHIIFTTRDSTLAPQLVGCNPRNQLRLQSLSKESSMKLLLGGLELEPTVQDFSIAEQFYEKHIGGVPLHLSILSSRIGRQSGPLKFRNLLEEFEILAGNEMLLEDPGTGESVHRGIAMSLDMVSPRALALFSPMCYLHTQGIPQRLLLPSTQPEARMIPLINRDMPEGYIMEPLKGKPDLEAQISELERVGVVSVVETAESEKTYWIHQLVASNVRALQLHIDPERTALAFALDFCSYAIPQHDRGVISQTEWKRAESMMDQFTTCLTFAKENMCKSSRITNMIIKVGYLVYHHIGDLDAAEELLLESIEDIGIPLRDRTNQELELLILFCRMKLHFPENSSIAGKLLSMVLAEWDRRFPVPNTTTLIIRSLLGWANLLSHADIAYEHFNSIAPQFSLIYGEIDSRTLLRRCYVARTLISQSRVQEAKTLLKAIELRAGYLTYDGRDEYPSLFYNLAKAYESLENYTAMENWARKAVASDWTRSPNDHPFIAWSCVLVLCSLNARELIPEMVIFLEEQQQLVGVEVKHKEIWKDFLSEFGTALLNSIWEVNGAGELVLLVDKLSLNWSQHNSFLEEQIEDIKLKAAVEADKGFLENAISAALKVVSECQSMLGRVTLGVSGNPTFALGLLGECLERCCAGNGTRASSAARQWQDIWKRQTSRQQLDHQYMGIWSRAWSLTEELQCLKIGINSKIQFCHAPDHSTFLIQAIWLGSVPAAKLLLDMGSDIHAIDDEYKTALFYAAEFHHFEIILLLLNSSKKKPRFNFDDITLLHLLCIETWQLHEDAREMRLMAVEALLRRGIDYDHKDKDGRTALELACINRQNDVAAELERFIKPRRRF